MPDETKDGKTEAQAAQDRQDFALVFTQEEADRVYNELREMSVDLDNDPLMFGPKRLNGKVAEVRKQLDRCERIFLDIAQRLHATKRRLRIEVTTLELAKKQLFANDPETRAGRSVSDREAIATGKLQVQVEHANLLDLSVQDLESVLIVVKAKRADLKDIQGRLRDQMRLCQEELGLGTHWGSRRPDAPELNLPPAVVAAGLDHVDDLLKGVEGEIHLNDWEDPKFALHENREEAPKEVPAAEEPVPPAEDLIPAEEIPPPPDKALPGTASQASVDAFLSGMPDVPAPVPAGGKGKGKAAAPVAMDDGTLDFLLESFEKP